jgi:hypothetical protein
MTLRLPGQRALRALSKNVMSLCVATCTTGRATSGGLLYHAREQGWRDGAAYYAFIEMFGVALRPKRSKS